MSGRRTIVLTHAVLLLVLMPWAISLAASASDSASFRTARVTTAGVSLQYPRAWIVFALTKRGIASQQKQLAKKDPRLAEAFGADVVDALIPTTKFHASDLGFAFAGGLGSDVRVQVVQGGFPSTLDNFRSVREPSVERSGGTVLNASTVRVGGKTSYRLDVELPVPRSDGTMARMRFGQLLVRRGGGRVIVTVSASDDDTGSKRIDHVLGSLRRI